MATEVVHGRLALGSEVLAGRLVIEDGWIMAVDLEDRPADGLPIIAPGFVDIHVHGFGGFDATGEADALSGMARALLRRGVTSFLPTAPSLPAVELPRFAERVRRWIPGAPADGAQPLGFNLEGPLLAPARRGAHDPATLGLPAALATSVLATVADGLRVITIAPELPGALELISRLSAAGVTVSLGHSAATLDEARAGYRAGARSTTHLFNAMTGADHHAPGLAAAALADDEVYAELIADGQHVHPALWTIVARAKPADRLVLVSDALPAAGMGDGPATIGGLAVDVVDGRATLAGTTSLAGSTIALDAAVRNLAGAGVPLPIVIAAATANPAALLGAEDRGRLAVGCRAHLVELDGDLRVRRVRRDDGWLAATA